MSFTVYKTYEDAEKHLPEAWGKLAHGGKQDVEIEQVTGGYAIAEFKFINNKSVFQGYYNERTAP